MNLGASDKRAAPDIRVEALHEELMTVERVFSAEAMARLLASEADVARYYSESLPLYLLAQNRAGAVHFALDGRDFGAQVRIVAGYLRDMRVRRVLELGSGMGYNAVRLARRLEGVHITGVDVTPVHVRLARWRAGLTPMVRFEFGDFHHLRFPPGYFGGIFSVESLCYARDLQVVLQETARVMCPGGRLVVIDGFRARPTASMSSDERLRLRLVTAAFAVSRTWTLGGFLGTAETAGLRVVGCEDLTQRVLPDVERMARIARFCLQRRHAARLSVRILPHTMTRNAIAAVLLPSVVRSGAYGYHAVVLER